jgi:D-xylose transport system substrate-binding protein
MLGVGKLQASYLLGKVPKGRYYLLAGDKEDNNARLFRQGQMIVMQPKIDSGDVKVVGDQWAGGWLSENAMKLTENVLTANNNKIDAILASNDSTAQGAIQALKEQGLAGKIPITGQDADLASCQAIVAGEQTMSVYKPLPKLASAAVQLAVDIAQGKKITTNATYPNGQKDVPSINLDIIAVDKDNIQKTVIADGFHSYDEVYKNVPEAQRPSR